MWRSFTSTRSRTRPSCRGLAGENTVSLESWPSPLLTGGFGFLANKIANPARIARESNGDGVLDGAIQVKVMSEIANKLIGSRQRQHTCVVSSQDIYTHMSEIDNLVLLHDTCIRESAATFVKSIEEVVISMPEETRAPMEEAYRNVLSAFRRLESEFDGTRASISASRQARAEVATKTTDRRKYTAPSTTSVVSESNQTPRSLIRGRIRRTSQASSIASELQL